MPGDNKPYESVKISLDDVASYHDKARDAHFVSDWLVLGSITQIDGLKKLQIVLNSRDKTLVDVDQEALIKDLERVARYQSTRPITIPQDSGEPLVLPPTLTNEKGEELPQFQQGFYQEVRKAAQDRSNAFKTFLQEYSEMPATKHCPESICAKMLIELSGKNANREDLQKKLGEALTEFKNKYAQQTAADIGSRNLIIFKDSTGFTKAMDIQEFNSLDSSILSGEQKNFIESCWQQGTFSGGWLGSNRAMLSGSKDGLPTYEERPLLVDCSHENQVKLFNQISAELTSPIAEQVKRLITGTLAVDISELKGEEFVIGCTASRPKIDIVISREDNDFRFELPRGLKCNFSSKHDNIRLYVENEYTQGYRNSFLNSKDFQEKARRVLGENDPVILQAEIRQAIQTNVDEQGKILSNEDRINKIKLCIAEQISKYSQNQHGLLNDVKVDKISKDLNIILEPLCHSDIDKKLLNSNIGRLVRECASIAGDKTSWSQSWHRFKDKIQDITANLINKKTNIQKLNEQYPEVVSAFRGNIKAKSSQGTSLITSNSPSIISKQPNNITR